LPAAASYFTLFLDDFARPGKNRREKEEKYYSAEGQGHASEITT
jgi:hypothetical protein